MPYVLMKVVGTVILAAVGLLLLIAWIFLDWIRSKFEGEPPDQSN